MDPIVLYEYVAKSPKGAGVNYRWAISEDGAYLLGKNPPGALRPQADPWWFATPLVELRRLDPAERAAVAAHIAQLPFGSGVRAPRRPSVDGDLARLTVGPVCLQVEDRCDDAHEAWIAGLVRILLPAAASVIDRRYP